MLRGENMQFRPGQFSFDSYLLSLSSNFTKMVTFEKAKSPGPSDCERMISVDCIMNTLEHSKIRLTFFIHPVQMKED